MMRDHYEGTPMDMRQDIGGGGNACPYRWRPMGFEADGKRYINERAIATQQTGFWFVGQARGWLPDVIGSLIWFGCDDAATSYLTPIYVSSADVPDCLRVGNGDMLHYSPTSQFWLNNRVSNACYKMYNQMEPYVRAQIDAFENEMAGKVAGMDEQMLSLYQSRNGSRRAVRRIVRNLTDFSVGTAQDQFGKWQTLEQTLLVKFVDGNVKAQNEDGSFRHSQYHEGTPDGLTQPGYTDFWKKAVAFFHGKTVEAR